MPYVDILIVILLIGALIRGVQIGMIRQIGSTLGFVAGLYPGTLLSSVIMNHVDSVTKPLAGMAVLLAICFILMTIGETIAVRLKHAFENKLLHTIDNSLGGIVSVFTLLIGIWLASALFQLAPPSHVQSALKNAHSISYLTSKLPPASRILSSLNALVDPNGSPQVFAGREPSPSATYKLPSVNADAAMLDNVRESVVKVEGLGCGGIVDGSGWVLSPGRVVTNAHVVAGVTSPKVTDSAGTHNTSVVLFDARNDIAVLRVDGLAATPLSRNVAPSPVGTPVFVLGYPGGGNYTVSPGVVLDQVEALGQDIYGQERTIRRIYSIQTNVMPGNSGGPVVDRSGQVVGVVFATSTTYNNVGYALTLQQVDRELIRAQTTTTKIGTGQCSD